MNEEIMFRLICGSEVLSLKRQEMTMFIKERERER